MSFRQCGEVNTKPRICFVSLSSYNLVADRQDIDHIGGAEVQQFLMARWLVEQGYEVTFVTHNHGQPNSETKNGIRIVSAYDKNAGVRGMRFFHPRWSGLWNALRLADADVYYQRGAGAETGQIALWCRLRKRQFIFGAANDRDLFRNLPFLPERREKYLFRLGLRLASNVITQSNNQRQILLENFGIESTVLRNSGSATTAAIRKSHSIKSVVWAGRFIPLKRLEWLLEVAESCPSFSFEIVGSGNLASEYVRDLMHRGEQLKNVHMHGRIPYTKMPDIYDQCGILCSTSIEEGFPNVFIEAWAAGIPVLSSFDPDGVIQKSGAGWAVNSVDEYVQTLTRLAADDNIWKKAAAAARLHYESAHRLSGNMPVFEKLL